MYELITPPNYYDYDKVERDSWGCGPGGLGDYLVPDTVYGLSVKPACQRHDCHYRFDEGKNEATRKIADDEFLKNMQIIVDATTNTWLLRRLRFTRCRTMYYAVRWFGKNAYYG